jgi:hypothetical protein
MKKLLSIIIVFICLQVNAFATLYLLCLEGQAYILETDAHGNIVGWHTYGGCAGGNWITPLEIYSGEEYETADELAAELNNYLDIEGGQPSLDEASAIYDLIASMNGTIVRLDPNKLDSDVLDLLTRGSRLAYSSTSITDNSMSQFLFYPNPAKDLITLRAMSGLNNFSSCTFEIINSLGQIIKKEDIVFEKGRFEKPIMISNLENGIYIIRCTNGANQSINRFIKN